MKEDGFMNIDTTHSHSIYIPEQSEWTCYLFGSDEFGGLSYTPLKGKAPNIFVRVMMKIFFDCKWVKEKK